MDYGVGLFPTEPLQRMIQLAKVSEELGFTHIWVGDSHLIWREAYVNLAAVALNTTKVKIGTGVTNPVTRHPSVVASAYATLEEYAPGRMIVGIGLAGYIAHKLLGISIGEQYPQVQNVYGSVTSVGLSENAANTAFLPDRYYWDYQVGFDAFWERVAARLDLAHYRRLVRAVELARLQPAVVGVGHPVGRARGLRGVGGGQLQRAVVCAADGAYLQPVSHDLDPES